MNCSCKKMNFTPSFCFWNPPYPYHMVKKSHIGRNIPVLPRPPPKDLPSFFYLENINPWRGGFYYTVHQTTTWDDFFGTQENSRTGRENGLKDSVLGPEKKKKNGKYTVLGGGGVYYKPTFFKDRFRCCIWRGIHEKISTVFFVFFCAKISREPPGNLGNQNHFQQLLGIQGTAGNLRNQNNLHQALRMPLGTNKVSTKTSS